MEIKQGMTIVISKWKAKEIAEAAGFTRPHFAMDVLKVERETERAIQLTMRLSAQRTTHCGVCGIRLTNPESVTAGIGPICAEKSGVSFSGTSLAELSEALKTTREVTSWLPKSAIKERFKGEAV